MILIKDIIHYKCSDEDNDNQVNSYDSLMGDSFL